MDIGRGERGASGAAVTPMIPARGNLIVTEVRTAETFAESRIIVPETVRDRLTSWQANVVAVGAPAACDARKCDRAHAYDGATRVHPCEIAAGDWVVVRPRAFIETDEPERRERVMAQDDVLAVLRP